MVEYNVHSKLAAALNKASKVPNAKELWVAHRFSDVVDILVKDAVEALKKEDSSVAELNGAMFVRTYLYEILNNYTVEKVDE